jgi:8-oxo-dGTP pyrophosphatase MutT (NUDIX family)
MKVNRDFFMARLAQTPGERHACHLRPAAVLLPIVDRTEPTVLFTLRTDHLPTHAGQVCFPGGRVHTGDETPVDTALRETREEIGVALDHIEVLGFLEPYNTGTGYSVIPVVGFVHPDHTLAPNMDEVAEVFEVPLDFLLDPRNGAWTQRARANGEMMDTYEIVFGRHVIWGATAHILMNFAGKLRA